jgi:formamidopyrimidine-DNA glycosylase
VQNLNREIVGAHILDIELKHPNLVELNLDPPPSPDQVLVSKNQYLRSDLGHLPHPQPTQFTYKVHDVNRRAKYIIIHLDLDVDCYYQKYILTHLGFTGWYVPEWATNPHPRRFLHPMGLEHSKMVITTDRGKLHLTDPRALSRTRIYDSSTTLYESKYLKNLGPDADTQEGLNALAQGIRKTGRRIRDVILDQNVAAGIGNYLACEILYRANLHGAEIAKTLTTEQETNLYCAIKDTFNLATTRDNHDWWAVFRRNTCPQGHHVTREAWSARGHYCCYTCTPPPPNKQRPN